MIEVQVKGLDQLERALVLAREELGRAARNSLNDTARQVQKDFRATLGQKFVLTRRPFIERQVVFAKQDQATKTKFEARLRIAGPAGTESVLTKFESDRAKHGHKGRMAVPARGIRTRGGGVKSGHRFKAFQPLVEMGGQYQKLRRRKGQLVAGKTLTSKRQVVGQRGSFVVTLPSGDEALVRRKKGSRRIEVLYYFQRTVPIPAPLEFIHDAERSALYWLPRNLDAAIEHALRRAGIK